MKVFRIVTSLDFGGIEKVCELHAKYHRHNLPYNLTFIALGEGGSIEKELELLGYRVLILNLNYRIPSPKCFWGLFRLFSKEKPDVVHTCGGEANFHGLLAAYFAGIRRRIGEEIGIPGHPFVFKLIFRIVYLTAHRVIAVSDSVSKFLVQYESVPDKVKVIYNPIDLFPRKKSLQENNKKFIISYLGRLIKHKNLYLLIDLVKLLNTQYKNRKFELLLIGDGVERGNLERYAQVNEVSDSVEFAGFINAPYPLLEKSKLFILPSFYEGFGLACIEAIQCEIPVIATNSGGIKEYIEDGKQGFLFDPNSFPELVDKVKLFLSLSDDEVMQMKLLAKKTVEEKFSPYKYLEDLELLYRSKV